MTLTFYFKGVTSHKFSKGLISGSGGLVQEGQPGNSVFVVEGPETGATIAATVATPEDTVIASLSLANLDSLGKLIQSFDPVRVLFAADNDRDNPTANKALDKAFAGIKTDLTAQGISVRLVKPEVPGLKSSKCDWNDLLKHEGPDAVIEQIDIY